MAGIGTVLADDPLLTCRIEGGSNPVRVICDTNLRIPMESRIVSTACDVPTIIATCSENLDKINSLIDAGCEIINLPPKDGRVSLKDLMYSLGERNIDSVYIEGGSTLHWSALASGIVNRVQTYIAPKLFGGADAPSPIGGYGIDLPENCVTLSKPQITLFGDDILLESEVIQCSQE